MKTFNFDFESMRNLDIQTIDPKSLVDLSDVNIKADLPFEERVLDYITQIKNPYYFRCGDVVVKVDYSDTDTTILECMEAYLRATSGKNQF